MPAAATARSTSASTAPCGHANVAVTHFPCGTGNDFIKMFGAEKERFFDLAELVRGEVRPFDVMECCGRYAINICSVGIDARIGTEVHQYHDSYSVVRRGQPLQGHCPTADRARLRHGL